jgi:8-oxo-dGTP pyrophosphatase MutT (NUDIX family)
MREESCGAVIYHGEDYLLLHYDAGHWDFPKGNREPGETRQETAIREIEEETGISVAKLTFYAFEKTINYVYRRENTTIFKTVTFFLAESTEKSATLSWEHQGFQWLPYEEALNTLTYDSARKVLEAVHTYMNTPHTKQLNLDSFQQE